MMKLKTLVAGLVFGCVSMIGVNAFAGTIMIDLNDFYTEGFVTIEADGSSATLGGDGDGDFSFDDGLLTNDPYYGEPGIVVPTGLLSLTFSYEFSEGAEADDEFYAQIFDGDTGVFIDEFYVDETESGTFSWDLSSLDASVTTLGMFVQLSEYADDTQGPDFTHESSFAAISNVYLTTEDSQPGSPVPEPSTMILFGVGIAGLARISRKQRG